MNKPMRFAAILMVCILSITGGFTQTTLLTEDFETDGEGVTYSGTFNDGNDVMTQTNSNPAPSFLNSLSGINGTGYIYSEDVDGASGAVNPNAPVGILTLNSVSVTGYSGLMVKIKVADGRTDGRFETPDKLEVQAQLDGGSFVTIGRFVGNANSPGTFSPTNSFNMTLDANLNGVGDPGETTVLTTTLTEYSFPVSGTGNSLVARVVVTTDGGSEELAYDFIRIQGTLSANVAPTLANIEGSTLSYTEGDPATQVTNTITVSDPDDVNLESATVSIITGFDPSEDVLAFTPTGSVTGSYNALTGVLSLSGTSSVADYQTALRSVTYQNTDLVNPSTTTRTVRFQVNDGTDNSNTQSRDISITPVVNAPAALPYCESFESDGEGTAYTSNTFDLGSGGANCDFFIRTNSTPACFDNPITGVDGSFFWASEDATSGGAQSERTLQLSPLIATGLADFTIEVLLAISPDNNPGGSGWETDDGVLIQYNMDGGTWTTVGAFYGTNPGGGTGGQLVQDADLNGVADPGGASLNATLTNYAFIFNATGTDLNVRIVVDQNGGSEELAFDNICVSGVATQVGPTLANIEGTILDYTEGDPATQVTSTITITDPDDTNMESATISICGGYINGEDVLAFTPLGGITGSFSAATGILSLTGSASIADYQTALRSVTYQNTNTTNPDNGTREVCFTVNDGDVNSNQQSRLINIIEVLNDPECLPYTESFETDGEGTRYHSNTFDDAPACNFFLRTNSQPICHNDPISGVDGNYYWAGEDVEGGSNGAVDAFVITAPATVTDYTALTVSVLLGVSNNGSGNRFEPDDQLAIQYSLDGGPWLEIGAFYGDVPVTGGHLRQDGDLDGQADPGGTVLTSTLQDFTFAVPATGDELQVRVLLNHVGGQEEIVFDHIRINGTFSGTPINITSQPTDRIECEGTSASFSVTASGTSLSYQWQEDDGGGFVDLVDGGIVSGATTATLNLTGITATMSGNLYRVVISSGCLPDATSNSASLTVDLESTPLSLVTASVNPVCPGQPTDLSASGGFSGTGADIYWYDGPNGSGNLLFIGAGFTASPTTSETYYVRREGTCNATADATLTVNVKTESAPLTTASASPPAICPGQSTDLTASGGIDGDGAIIMWYTGPNGTGTNFASGPGPHTVSPSVTTTYYARREGDCNTTIDIGVSVTVKTESTPLTTASASLDPICAAQSTDLSASGGSNGTGAIIVWYDGPNGTGNQIGTGSPISVSPTVTTTYYARREGDCNTTTDVSVTVTVKTESTPLTTASASVDPICPGQSTDLSASGGTSGAGAIIVWYDGPNGTGNQVGTGSPITVSPTSTTTYYARREGDCNTTADVSVSVTVKTESTPLTTVTASVNPICFGQSTDLTASGGTSGTGAIIVWYSGPNGTGTQLGTGAVLTVSPTTTTTYYVRREGDCNTTADASITVIVGSNVVVDAGPNQTVYVGYAPQASATLTANVSGAVAPLSYLWSTGETTQSITVSPTSTTTYSVLVTDANGCTGTDDVVVCAIDVRCKIKGNKHKILICHIPPGNPAKARTLCVSQNAVAAHLAHGDQLGSCGTPTTCSGSNGGKSATVDDLTEEEGVIISASPNPFSSQVILTFKVPISGYVKLEIVNVTGQLLAMPFEGEVEAGNYQQVKFGGAHLSAGIYMARLHTALGVYPIKLLVND